MPRTEWQHQTVTIHTVDQGSDDRRIDNLLIGLLKSVPKSHVYRLIRSGQVRVNSRRIRPDYRVRLGDRVRIPPVRLKVPRARENVSANLKTAISRIIYEDEFILAIDKPSGIAVHSGTNHAMGLIEAVRNLREDIPDVELVHRLDKDTSGILLLAKDKKTLRKIHSMWNQESNRPVLTKIYVALLQGQWRWNTKLVETDFTKMKIPTADYRKIKIRREVSHFTTAERFGNSSLVRINLLTGRTHQARRQAVQIGHPIAGDRKFGTREFNGQMRKLGLKRLFLHAGTIKMEHPANGRQIKLDSPLPRGLGQVLDQLRQKEINL